MSSGARRIRPITEPDLDRITSEFGRDPAGMPLTPEPGTPESAALEPGGSDRGDERRPVAGAALIDRPQPEAAWSGDWSWARDVFDVWGMCGVLVQQDGAVAGFLALAPAPIASRTGRYANAHLSPEVGVVLGVYVRPEHRGHGVGRQLVQAAAAESMHRKLTAIEAIGCSVDTSAVPADAMATLRAVPVDTGVPTDFLTAVGFRVVQPHPVSPRLRMDLSSTVRWIPDLAAAWQRFAGLVSKPIPAQPAGFEQSRQAEEAVGRS